MNDWEDTEWSYETKLEKVTNYFNRYPDSLTNTWVDNYNKHFLILTRNVQWSHLEQEPPLWGLFTFTFDNVTRVSPSPSLKGWGFNASEGEVQLWLAIHGYQKWVEPEMCFTYIQKCIQQDAYPHLERITPELFGPIMGREE